MTKKTIVLYGVLLAAGSARAGVEEAKLARKLADAREDVGRLDKAIVKACSGASDAECTEYVQLAHVAERRAIFTHAIKTTALLTPQMDPGPDFVKQALDHVTKCTNAVDELVAAGVPASLEVRFGYDGGPFTIGELKSKVCGALESAANTFAKGKAERDKKFTEKFTKVGIAGDKLEIMKANDGGLFLPGGASSSDYRKYAASSLMFVWLTSDPDDAGYVTHTVRRYQFAGNKLVKQTEKTYRKPKGAKLGDVFR